MYIYIIKPKEYINTNVIKIGMSSVANLSRLRSYGANTRYIGMSEIGINYLSAEKELIRSFRENFSLARGREYFYVDDEVHARKLFFKTVDKYIDDLRSNQDSTQIVPSNGIFDRFKLENMSKSEPAKSVNFDRFRFGRPVSSKFD